MSKAGREQPAAVHGAARAARPKRFGQDKVGSLPVLVRRAVQRTRCGSIGSYNHSLSRLRFKRIDGLPAMRLPPILLSILLMFSVAGCGQNSSRLQGKWVFDRQRTEDQLSHQQKEKPKEGTLEGMKQGLVEMLVPSLIEKLDGATLTITRKEMIITTKDGTGQAEGYEIIEHPDANTWRVKTAAGKVESYTLEGEWLTSPTSGDVHLTTYFKRQ